MSEPTDRDIVRAANFVTNSLPSIGAKTQTRLTNDLAFFIAALRAEEREAVIRRLPVGITRSFPGLAHELRAGSHSKGGA
jgi:hypothetical protein